ncbi:hypothetical protein KFL_001410250 [Klebsormidium nitens]|uniref:BTB domain-containing protein n=1 Tax=Klebsormidium nitens TaxID=105231 RepID=A0A0U9HUZ6_KLENI|nr:hypothetical protein KFL_001410250 [Klebsormidium nitens]|eukprot:GAQ83268.1 hypothetical protein KFL_001410250 [Klebsormidium nitens]
MMDLSALAEALPPLDQGDVTLVVCEGPDGFPEKLLGTEGENAQGSIREQASDGGFGESPKGAGGHATKFLAHKSVLLSSSDYFKSLFSNFKEATQETVTVHWDATIFAKVLGFLYGKELNIEPNDILPLIQSAYMFGIESLLGQCRNWISSCTPRPGQESGPVVDLESACGLWTAAKDVARDAAAADAVAELCVVTLAVFFEDAVAQQALREAPLELLMAVVNSEHLTVPSEKVVCEALLDWATDKCADVWSLAAKEIRWAMLPLPFRLGLRRRSPPLGSVLDAALLAASQPRASASSKRQPTLSKDFLPRVSEFLEGLDLRGCQQFNEASFFSLFRRPCPRLTRLDLSDCWRLRHHALLFGLADLLPSLAHLTAVNCPHLPSAFLLGEGHPNLQSLDLSVSSGQPKRRPYEPSPDWMLPGWAPDEAPTQFDDIWTPRPVRRAPANKILGPGGYSDPAVLSQRGLVQPRCAYPRLVDIALRKRSDVGAPLLHLLASTCPNLTSLDVSWCPDVADDSLAALLLKLPRLTELRAAGTKFGRESAAALLARDGWTQGTDEPSRGSIEAADAAASVREGTEQPASTFPSGKPCGENANSGPLLGARAEQGGFEAPTSGVLGADVSWLRVLDVSHCRELGGQHAAALTAGLDRLEEISLSGIVASGSFSFASSSIRRLDVNGLRIPGDELAMLLRKNPRLQRLDVRGCNQVGSRECSLDDGGDCSRLGMKDGCSRAESTSSGKTDGHRVGSKSAAERSADGHRQAEEPFSVGPSEQPAVWGEGSKLETLKVSWGFGHGSFRRLGSALGQLRSLTLGLGAAVSDADLAELAGACPRLEHLRLRMLMISGEGILPVVRQAQHLSTLSLHHCAGPFTPRLLDTLCGSAAGASLRTLKLIGGISTLDDACIARLANGLPTLEKLALAGARRLTPAALKLIAEGWPALRHLALENCGRVTADGADVLFTSCFALASLKLVHSGRGLPVDFIRAAHDRMPMLTSLFLDGCDAADGKFALIEPMATSVQGPLQSIQIGKCKKDKALHPAIRMSDPENYSTLVRICIDKIEL